MSVPTTIPDSSTAKALLPELRPNVDHIVTEDDQPVDNIYSEKQMRLLTEPLYASWDAGKPFVATANVGLFYGVRLPPIVPDVLLSKHVELPENLGEKSQRSYFMWEYGKPPEAVIEIVSNLEGEETTRKPQIYARIGVAYYIIWDPDSLLGNGRLQVLELRAQSYVPIAAGWLPLIQLGIMIWHGVFEAWENDWLRWCDAGGNPIPTGAERAAEMTERAQLETQRATQAAQRAQQEAQRAQQEALRADEATQLVQRLEAQLRALGAKPKQT